MIASGCDLEASLAPNTSSKLPGNILTILSLLHPQLINE